MLRRVFLRGAALFIAAAISTGAIAPPAMANDAARTLVMDAAERLITLITSPGGREAKEADFLQLMNETSAMTAIARTALGAPWRSMTDAQKQRYDVVFPRYLARNYVARFRDYTGEELAYVDTTETDKGVFVKTVVTGDAGQPLEVVWRLKELRGALKIVDIKAADLSLLATERAILNSLLEQNNGDFDRFLDALERGGQT